MRARAIAFSLAFALVTSLILVFQLLPADRVTLEEGDVCPQDIRAPREITYVSQVLTEEARARAEAAVKDIYDPPEVRIARKQVTKARQILDYLDSVRHDGYATPEQRREWIEAIPDLSLSAATIDHILAFADDEWQKVANEAVYVVDRVMRMEIREGQVAEAKRTVPTYIGLYLSDDQREVVKELAQGLIVPNSFYNAEKTAEAKRLARERVQPVTRTIAKGEAILREGDIVELEDLEALEQLGLRQARIEWQDILGTLIFVLLVTTALVLYLLRFQPDFWANWRHALLLFLLLVLFVLVAKLMVPGHVVLAYLFPSAALPMLLTALLGPQLAIVAAVLVAAMVGFMTGGSLELTIYALAGGLIASINLGRVRKLSAFLWAGVHVALANLAVVLAFRLPGGDYDMMGLLTLAAASVANGGLAASLTLAGFYLLGSIFDITTSLQLMELARPNHPLLRQLLLKAPGTYHHSLLVSNMAEQAAERIGADALLARVGAYYHDIGKIVRPYFFAENQVKGMNVHDRLDPQTSAKIIIGHVLDGLELAKKYRLPRRVRDFIAQHHGTGLASYFYRQACQQGEAEEVKAEDFRYPGPKPQTKETAIVMLADACEATVRSAHPTSPEEVERLVRKVIEHALLSGELDECDLTLRELDEIRGSFVNILQGVFHPRVKYPEATTAEEDEGNEGV
ncbi:MAG TPA: HDIG domain-containing protein [Anaerolineae bacterium]|nr:HDIG domain-containing protein [Anaerolineae bacterium]